MQDKLGPLTFVFVCHWKLEYFLRLHVVCVLKIQFTITWVWHLHSYPNHPTFLPPTKRFNLKQILLQDRIVWHSPRNQ